MPSPSGTTSAPSVDYNNFYQNYDQTSTKSFDAALKAHASSDPASNSLASNFEDLGTKNAVEAAVAKAEDVAGKSGKDGFSDGMHEAEKNLADSISHETGGQKVAHQVELDALKQIENDPAKYANSTASTDKLLATTGAQELYKDIGGTRHATNSANNTTPDGQPLKSSDMTATSGDSEQQKLQKISDFLRNQMSAAPAG